MEKLIRKIFLKLAERKLENIKRKGGFYDDNDKSKYVSMVYSMADYNLIKISDGYMLSRKADTVDFITQI